MKKTPLELMVQQQRLQQWLNLIEAFIQGTVMDPVLNPSTL